MKTLLIANDPRAFDEESAVRGRLRAYARALGEVHVLSAAPRGTLEVHEHTLHLYPVRATRLLRIPALARRARALVRTQGIEVISAQDPFEYGLAALIATRGVRARLHIQLHTDPFARDFARLSLANRLRIWLMPFVINRAERIRVVSEHLKDELLYRYYSHVPITVLPVYADLARFRAVVRVPQKGQLLWIGRFEREKDPMLALEALALARADGSDATLALLGAGHLEAALRAQAMVLGISTEVEFPGHVDPLPYLARAELLLATSRYEGYGLAIVEALAAGVPVLATDAGIAREAGALIAGRNEYAAALVSWFRSGPKEGRLTSFPYASFEEYVAAYAADIEAAGGA